METSLLKGSEKKGLVIYVIIWLNKKDEIKILARGTNALSNSKSEKQ